MQAFPPQLPGSSGAPGPPSGASPSLGSLLARILIGLVAVGIVVGLVIILVPVVLTAAIVFFVIAVLFALYVIIRAKARRAMGLPPKPIIGVRAQAMRDYAAQRRAGVPPFDEADRENVRVRSAGSRPAPTGDASESAPREVIDVEASPSRETP